MKTLKKLKLGTDMVKTELEKKKEKLEIEKSRLAQKERLLRKRMEKKKLGKLIEMGRLCVQAGIGDLERETLLGALLEIANLAKDEKTKAAWEKTGKEALFCNKQDLIISFTEGSSDEIKRVMVSHFFKWVPFRKEWHGRGEKDRFEKILEGQNAKIEVITN